MKPVETLQKKSVFIFDDDKEPPLFDKVFYRIKYRIENSFHGIKFFEKYGYKNSYAETEENKSVSYIYHMSEKYINEQIEKSPDLKEFGGLASECLSDECDLHIKEPENYSFIRESIHYRDSRYLMEIQKRALEGFRLFGEYFTAF